MQVIALHVADHLAVQVQLVQVPAVVQVVDLAAIRQGQCGQVAERVVFIVQRAARAQQVIAVTELFIGDAQLFASSIRWK
ncbi:hypothetical protein D3C75_926810 [compost metagenome]